MTSLFLKILGVGLLAICGGGIGWSVACRKRETAHKITDFERFLQYVSESIRFRSLPGVTILTMAAQHTEFASFCPRCVTNFSQILLPDGLEMECGAELREGLRTLETSSRQTACDILAHLRELCHHAGMQARERALYAQRIYPRTGTCFGLLVAIVLF